MDDNRKYRLKLGLATGMSLFSLLSVFIGVFAWFSVYRQVQADNDLLRIQPSPLPFTKLEIYPQADSASASDIYQFDTTAGVTYTFDWSKEGGYTQTGTSVALTTYNRLEHNKAVLYVLTLRDGLSDEERKGASVGLFTKTAYDKSLFRKDESSTSSVRAKNPLLASGNPLSNVLAFRTATLPSALSATGSVFDLASSVSGTTAVQFVSALDASGFLDSSASYKTSLSLLDGTSLPSDAKQVVVVAEYDLSLFDALFSINLGNDVVMDAAGEKTIGFDSDWGISL